MITQREKVIALLSISPNNLVSRIVAVRLGAVGMQIPLVKTPG
jgi:hypothetical protein